MRIWSEILQGESTLFQTIFNHYRPELHYMRGPGPKWLEKHGSRGVSGPGPCEGSLQTDLQTNHAAQDGTGHDEPGRPRQKRQTSSTRLATERHKPI
jgi:hypothetical protein